MFLVFMPVSVQITSGQTGKEQSYPIPEDISRIFQASCYSCHGSKGKMLPMAKLNFAKWAEYGTKNEAEKASKICSMLDRGYMPPNSVRKSNPELIPTKEQIASICKWVESLKLKAKGK
jgi:hypothetical protein